MENENNRLLLEFLNKATSGVCLLEGQAGSDKTKFLKQVLEQVENTSLIFSFKCFEGSTIDDVFLTFFEDIKKYSQQKRITLEKIETNSIAQRINRYLSSIQVPCVIVFDSFENILNKQNEREKEEFFRYIKYLHKQNHFKIIIASTKNLPTDLGFAEYLRLNASPFKKEQIQAYFTSLNLSIGDVDLSNLFDLTKGVKSNIYLVANIVGLLKTSVSALLQEYTGKQIIFQDFLFNKLLTLVPDTVKKTLFILSLFNVGVASKFFINQKLLTEEQYAYLIEKNIVFTEYGQAYLSLAFKTYLQKNIPAIEKVKYHTYLREFFTTQLPLKPRERLFLVSRNTIRSQIEYHSTFVLNDKQQDVQDMSLMSYLNSNLTAWNYKNTNIKDFGVSNNSTASKDVLKNNKDFEKYALTKDEIALLSLPVDLNERKDEDVRKDLARTFEQQEEILRQKSSNESIKALFATASDLLSAHDYETAFVIFAKALSARTDELYAEYEPILLERLAFCAKKMNKLVEAINYYNKLTELYSLKGDLEKMNEIRLEIAQIYKETLKFNQARVIYETFISKKVQASDSILARAYIELAQLEEDVSNNEKAIEYFKKAFIFINDGVQISKSILAQAYFKFAILLDDFNQTEAALDYYKRSIKTDKNNPFLSLTYTNMAEIIKENGNPIKAMDYYKLGLKVDLANENFEGVYYICLKLALLYEKIEPKKVFEFLKKSLTAAKKTGENIYIVNAYVEIGDYSVANEDFSNALKAFLFAKKYCIEQDDIYTIEHRINDVKANLSQNDILNIVNEVEQNG